MNKVLILSDSTCDLSEELLEKYDIKIVPLYINIGDNIYQDLVELTTEKMYDLIAQNVGFPKSSATTPNDFEEVFRKYIDEGYDILYTGISSTLSCTLQNAYIAKSNFDDDRIYLVDSKNLSTGIGLLVLKAAKLREQGLSAKEIAAELENIVPRVRSQFVIEKLDYLYKGGRCSGMTYFIGNAIKIKLYIKVIDGKMEVAKKVIGSVKKGLNFMMEEFVEQFDNLDKEFVFITDSMADESKKYIKDKLQDKFVEFENVCETGAGCVISSHCGSGCIGILYIVK